MSSIAIKVENLSKKYLIGSKRNAQDGLRHRIEAAVRNPWRWLAEKKNADKNGPDEFWAINDVSFQIKQGEVIGIIGRNGAGKSTLLKILSRITEPTSGRINIKGRVASLLEVGTGFHPELTGRENIFLNGAILGMSQKEITRKFDDIVEFSEIEKFLDTPVKRYSSGMYVRLAFAVAAHLEPEILICDEVLAVGDAQFQKKCLGKMQDVSKQGRTVLFVSHNMQAILALCSTAIWLEGGKLVEKGDAKSIADKYNIKAAAETNYSDVPVVNKKRTGTGAGRFVDIKVQSIDQDGKLKQNFETGCSWQVDLEILCHANFQDANVAVTVNDTNGYRLVDVNTALKGEFLSLKENQKSKVRFLMENVRLKPGKYVIELWLGRGGVEEIDFVKDVAVIEVFEDMDAIKHTETFPGVYQCGFTHQFIK
jgi:lipopolysaccharide transport system ATP-binding protein